ADPDQPAAALSAGPAQRHGGPGRPVFLRPAAGGRLLSAGEPLHVVFALASAKTANPLAGAFRATHPPQRGQPRPGAGPRNARAPRPALEGMAGRANLPEPLEPARCGFAGPQTSGIAADQSAPAIARTPRHGRLSSRQSPESRPGGPQSGCLTPVEPD